MTGQAALGELYHHSNSVDTYDANGNLTGTGYDVLNQLVEFNRGTLGRPNNSTVSGVPRNQTWTLDALGNCTNLQTNIRSQNQNRTGNRQNELTQIKWQR